jgi:Na+-translocating ferredoxin:NAD+ oxidoreductase RnfC subunit
VTNQIVQKTEAAGVVGGGGAGFPAHVKINSKADTVLINAASCEPLLCSDIHLIEQYCSEFIRGLELLVEAVGAEKGMICIKRKHEQCITILEKEIAAKAMLSVFPMDDFYPAGDEHVMVNVALGRIVPEGGIPLEVGVVVTNVESVFNIARACDDKPVTHRTLNIAGEVPNPIVVRVPVGMRVAEVLALAGGMNDASCKVIDGGPMMGKVLDDPNSSYVTKTTSGLIVLPPEHNIITGKNTPIERMMRITRTVCCQCTLCTELCPRYQLGHNLHPHLIMRSLGQIGDPDHPILQEALLCSECGICEKWSCPMHISPREVNAAIKKQVNGRPKDIAQNRLGVHPYTDYRRVPVKRLMGKLNIMQYDRKPQVSLDEIDCDTVGLSLRRHIGAPSLPVVNVGDRVERGQLVATIPPNSLGANVHASISGKVTAVDDNLIFVTKE